MSLKGLRPLSLFIATALLSLEGISAAPGSLQFLGSKKLDYSEDQPILGISSIRYDKAHHQFILLSDDTGTTPNYYNKNGQPRYYLIPEETLITHQGLVRSKSTFLQTSGRQVTEVVIQPNDTILWTTHGHVDTKGFDFLGDNALLIASEQNSTFLFNRIAPWIRIPGWHVHSALLKVGRDGSLLGVYHYPNEFSNTGWRCDWTMPHWMPGSNRTGVKRNRGFETITHLPGTRDYLAITEQSVLQDDKDWKPSKGTAPSRVLRFSMAEPEHRVSAYVKPSIQYFYQPTPVPKTLYNPWTDVTEQSISDAQAINGHQFLVVEKTHVKRADSQTVTYGYTEVYLVDLNDPLPSLPDNISSEKNNNEEHQDTQSTQCTQCTGTSLPILRKQRLLSTRHFEKTFPNFKRINIEGVTLGPAGSKDSKLLVLVSNNGANTPKPRSTDILFFKVPDPLFEMK